MRLSGNDWEVILKKEVEKPYYKNLWEFIEGEYSAKQVYPPLTQVFDALEATSYENTKVVILGQDPYIRPGQAHGMSFSVQDGVPLPPSLRNIFLELREDIGVPLPLSGNLVKWAMQGVLLLNTILTAEAGKSGSHAGKGWEQLTDSIIQSLDEKPHPIVFLLWGKKAQAKAEIISSKCHKILEAAHPSPLARGRFFGSRPFSQTNLFLRENGLAEIDWSL